jgi:hypothetical protein
VTRDEQDGALAAAVAILDMAHVEAFDALLDYENRRYEYIYRGGEHPKEALIDFLEAWRAAKNAHQRAWFEYLGCSVGCARLGAHTACERCGR